MGNMVSLEHCSIFVSVANVKKKEKNYVGLLWGTRMYACGPDEISIRNSFHH